jgi:hypothetical protein
MEGDYFTAIAMVESEEERLLGGGRVERVESKWGNADSSWIASYAVENVVRSKSQAGELLSQRPDVGAYSGRRIYRHQPAPGLG